MNKTDFISQLSEKSGAAKEQVKKVWDAAVDLIIETVAAGDNITIPGFGTLERRYHNPRTGRNPQTGESIEIAGKHVPAFKPAKAFKDAVSSAG